MSIESLDSRPEALHLPGKINIKNIFRWSRSQVSLTPRSDLKESSINHYKALNTLLTKAASPSAGPTGQWDRDLRSVLHSTLLHT